MQRNSASLRFPVGDSGSVALTDSSNALATVTERVATLLAPMLTIPRYRDGQYDSDAELW